MKIPGNLRWAVPALTTFLLAMASGCQSDPVVIEVPVTVEVIREVVVQKEVPAGGVDIEATVEARVSAALATAVPDPIATSSDASRPIPTATAQPDPTGTTTPELKLSIRQSMSAGSVHACGLREGGLVECWGNNKHGQLDAPREKLVWISAGGQHTCGLREDGTSVCWGANDSGQSDTGGNRFAAIHAGNFHTCALRENGDAVCWGEEDFGQLNSPDGGFTAIAAGFRHTCALRKNGDAECWGYNGNSQATDVRGEGFAAISAGFNHTCALRADGSGTCWGGGGSSSDKVKMLPLDGPFMAITAGWAFTCALSEDGEVICWGDNEFGQLDVPGGIRFAAIGAGFRHACALRETGEAVCWGSSQSPPPGRFALPSIVRSSRALPSGSSFDVASVLARFSTTDPAEGEKRAEATSEIISQYILGNTDTARVLELLHTLAPELSIDERRRAANELASMSDDDQWDESETARAAFYLGSIITGDEPNPEERIEAANEMVILYRAGELDADNALNLMNTIAPGLSIDERRQAAGALARLSVDGDWDDADKMAAASEVFRLVTGVPLNAQERMGAAVDLTGVGVKIFDRDNHFDDKDIDKAAEIIKQSLTGELTTDSLKGILGSND